MILSQDMKAETQELLLKTQLLYGTQVYLKSRRNHCYIRLIIINKLSCQSVHKISTSIKTESYIYNLTPMLASFLPWAMVVSECLPLSCVVDQWNFVSMLYFLLDHLPHHHQTLEHTLPQCCIVDYTIAHMGIKMLSLLLQVTFNIHIISIKNTLY